MSLSIIVPPLPYPVTIDQILQALKDANTTRYLSVVGLVVLVYDHALTFGDEVRLVWAAPRSFAKYAYIFNRYLVLSTLLAVAHEMCGFAGPAYSSIGYAGSYASLIAITYNPSLSCRHFLTIVCILSLVSVALGNILVLLRVVLLWDHRPIIFRLMTAGFIASFSAQATLMILTLVELSPGVYWMPAPLSMCVTTFTTPKLIGVWASPMLFEVLVLVSTILNAFDRPHQAELPVTKALYRDGIVYFFAVSSFRALNLILAIVGSAAMSMLSVFFAWAMITTVLSRSLLNMRQQELMSDQYSVSGRASPFNMRTGIEEITFDDSDPSPSWLQMKMRSSV